MYGKILQCRDFNKCTNTCASPFGDIVTISLFNTIEGGNITAIFVFNRAVEADFLKAKIKADVQGALTFCIVNAVGISAS